MAVETGLGATLSIDDSSGTPRAISADIRNLTLNMGRESIDVSPINSSAMQRLLGRGNCSITGTASFDDATNLGFDVFKTICSADVARTVSYAVSGQTFAFEGIITQANFGQAQNGDLTVAFTIELSDGTDPTWA